jgi:type IV pilus assembly protein PilM
MLGIDISDRSIKIAEVVRRGGVKLRSICWSALAANIMRRGVIQDVAVATAALQDAMKRCSPRPPEDRVAVASIPETQSFVRVLELPQMKDSEVDEAIQWAVRQHIPFDLERVYLGWQSLPQSLTADNRRSVLVGAAQRDVVDPLLQVLDGAGLQVVALELEAQAIVRALLPTASADIRGILIVDLGATSTNVIYFDQGMMRYTANIQLGGDDLTQNLAHSLHIEPNEAAEKKSTVGVGQSGDPNVGFAVREVTLQLLEKIKNMVQEMMTQDPAQYQINAILLSGGSANLPGINQIFGEVFPGIPVEIGNPWTNLYIPGKEFEAPLSSADATHFITAIGLALRQPDAL